MTNKVVKDTLLKAVLIKSNDRMSALDQLLSHILRAKSVGNPQQVTRIIIDHEEALSSGIGSGIAVPHVRHEDIKEVTVVFGMSKNGIGWMSPDYSPVHFVCMLFSPNDNPDYYLEVLGCYLSKLRDEKFRNKLLKCQNEKELRSLWVGQAAAKGS